MQVRIIIWEILPAAANITPIDLSLIGSVYPSASSRIIDAPDSLPMIVAHAKRDISDNCSLVPPLKWPDPYYRSMC